MILRLVAGIFAGVGGLLSIYLGVTHTRQELITGGLLILNTVMMFFVGENNGKKKAAE